VKRAQTFAYQRVDVCLADYVGAHRSDSQPARLCPDDLVELQRGPVGVVMVEQPADMAQSLD
jgi:hypothetical protein